MKIAIKRFRYSHKRYRQRSHSLPTTPVDALRHTPSSCLHTHSSDNSNVLYLYTTFLRQLNLRVGDVEIKKEDQINLLGVNLDSKLTFTEHVSDICDRVNNQLKIIKRFRNIASNNTKSDRISLRKCNF